MSKPDFLGHESTLKLIRELQNSIREHVGREKELSDDFAVKKYQLNKAHNEALEGFDFRARSRYEEQEGVFGATLLNAETFNQNRLGRIGRAHVSTEEQLDTDLDQREGGGAFRLQKVAFMSERERDNALEQCEGTLRERRKWLQTADSTTTKAEKQSRGQLRGYPSLSGQIKRTEPDQSIDAKATPKELFKGYQKQLVETVNEVKALKKQTITSIFSAVPIPLWVVLLAAGQWVSVHFGYGTHLGILPYTLGTLAILVGLCLFGKKKAQASAEKLAPGISRLKRYRELCPDLAEKDAETSIAKIKDSYSQSIKNSETTYEQSLKEAEEIRASRPAQIETKHARLLQRHEVQAAARLAAITSQRDTELGAIQTEDASQRAKMISDHEETIAMEQSQLDSAMAELQSSWDAGIKPKLQQLAGSSEASDTLFPAWGSEGWNDWEIPTTAGRGVRFGHVDIDVEQLADGLPESRGLVMPELQDGKLFSAPLHLNFPQRGSFLIESDSAGQQASIAALNNLVLRLLAALPPGKVTFTILDPVGLGENFSSLMHLADYEEGVINNKIWTQPQQIDQRLAELTEHMEKVIQMYLRNDFETIVDYNEQAGNIAEKYHFLVIADYPSGFSEQAAKRLQSIASSGGKCGVFTLIHLDPRHDLPNDFNLEDLRAASIHVATTSDGTPQLPELKGPGVTLRLDPPPSPEEQTKFLQRVGDASIDSSRVEVPFDQVVPTDADLWSRSTESQLTVPIGRTGATKFQELAIGKGTRQHALLAGKTGSGKSTLFHVMITNLALWCSPDEVEFYLVDFKKGVEFKCYATRKLPHARVIAIESDREFGLSVLQRVDEELRRRGEAFRKLGVQDVAGYLKAGGEGPMPRTLLMIDEFQELFTEEDRVSQDASVLLDRIVRQGRAFGIHVILGSQTLGGAFTLARTTLGQMAIRIALMCDESDAYLIMDENNSAPRLLTRPGEGIYNDMSGKPEGNSPFQVVWLPDDVRDAQLNRLMDHVKTTGKVFREPVVFEGNVPAEIRDNIELREAIAAPAGDPTAPVRIWLGSPNSIKGPSNAALQRSGGNNVLIIGTREDAALSILSVGLVSLAAQFRNEKEARIVLIDSTAPGTAENDLLGRATAAIKRPLEIARAADIDASIGSIYEEFQKRSTDGSDGKPPVFLLIHSVQKFKKLRYEDDFSFSMDEDDGPKPGNQLSEIICEGPGLGIHVILACDTYSNLGRFLSRKALQECELRVLFQMSANDSAALIDSPKAGTLGMSRGLFYNEQEGYQEIFHPYALPGADWFEEAGEKIG